MKKIAFLLPNPCNPDYRVIKHAETFAARGFEVRVYCRWKAGLPLIESVNGVTYIRKEITEISMLRKIVKRIVIVLGLENLLPASELTRARAENKRLIKEMGL